MADIDAGCAVALDGASLAGLRREPEAARGCEVVAARAQGWYWPVVGGLGSMRVAVGDGRLLGVVW